MMKRRKTYTEESPLESLILRDKMGLKRYRKVKKRDEEERKILIDLALKKIREKENSDFIRLGYKRTKAKVSSQIS